MVDCPGNAWTCTSRIYPKIIQNPVVIFVTGGAWTIGYKAWGALLAKRLCEKGILVACLDYRNFPQGNAQQMLEDVNTGISWVIGTIHRYGGDPNRIFVVGQSAGGHLASFATIRQAEQLATGRTDLLGAFPEWSPTEIQGFVGVSGAYDLEALMEHLHKRGLYRNLFKTVMSISGKPAVDVLSPLHAVRCAAPGTGQFMPKCLLIHGTKDKSVPHKGTEDFAAALEGMDVRVMSKLFPGKTHTRFLIEDPMCGGRDYLMEAVLGMVTGKDEVHHYSPLCPQWLCDLASYVCPF